MGSKSDTWENGLLLLLFNNTAFTLVGDAAGLLPSAAAGSLYLSLHTSDPGEAGDQTTNETAYTSYARAAIARSGAGFTVTGNSVVNAAIVDHPKCTASPGAAVTHFGVGTDSSGAGKLLYSGTLTTPITMSVGTIPRCEAGALAITES